MEGTKRGLGKKENDFIQTYLLFKEIFFTFNQKMQQLEIQTKDSKMKQSTNSQYLLGKVEPTFSREQGRIRQKQNEIKIKYRRDWQGLCSERKEDIFGQYQICFDYTFCQMEKEEEMQQKESKSDQSFNN